MTSSRSGQSSHRQQWSTFQSRTCGATSLVTSSSQMPSVCWWARSSSWVSASSMTELTSRARLVAASLGMTFLFMRLRIQSSSLRQRPNNRGKRNGLQSLRRSLQNAVSPCTAPARHRRSRFALGVARASTTGHPTRPSSTGCGVALPMLRSTPSRSGLTIPTSLGHLPYWACRSRDLNGCGMSAVTAS